MIDPSPPTFVEERRLAADGFRHVAGIDEAGRGPLAGPVVAAAVVLSLDFAAAWLGKVRDSKQLTATARQTLFTHIHQDAVAVGVGCTESDDIDRIGIVPATRRAMRLVVESLVPSPEAVLIDYMTVPEIDLPQRGITGGDRLCLSIACASIIAKVTRDRMMVRFEATHPGYGFARHKGYCTRDHVACLRRLGPCPIHRRSFNPVRAVMVQ